MTPDSGYKSYSNLSQEEQQQHRFGIKEKSSKIFGGTAAVKSKKLE